MLKKNFESERSKLEAQIFKTQEDLTKLAAEARVRAEDQAAVRPEGEKAGAPVQLFPTRGHRRAVQGSGPPAASGRFRADGFHGSARDGQLPGSQVAAEKVRELEFAVDEARRKRLSYRRYVARLKVRAEPPDAEPLEARLLTQDLQYLKRLQETIKSKLAQLDFEIGQQAYRVTVQDKAAVPKVPANNWKSPTWRARLPSSPS